MTVLLRGRLMVATPPFEGGYPGSSPGPAALRLALLAQCRPLHKRARRSVLSLSKDHMYFIYLIECSDGSLYTGITTNVGRRFNEHKNKTGGHYTSSKEVVHVAYTEEHPDRSSALKREAQIKSWPREKKLALIKSNVST